MEKEPQADATEDLPYETMSVLWQGVFCIWKAIPEVLLTALLCGSSQEGGESMSDALNAYRAAMAVALGLFQRGLISQEEYHDIDRITAQKYSLDLSTICCRNPLIITGFRGNMGQIQ